MKLAYERPMMYAEMYQANGHITACGDNQSFAEMLNGVLKLSDIAGWLKPGAGNSQSDAGDTLSEAWTSAYGGLEFSETSKMPMTSQAGNTSGQTQYYWSTSVGETKYYLEYSAGRTKANDNLDTFILYKENTNNNSLNINWYTYQGVDNDDTYIPLLHPYDDSLAGFYFNQKVIAKS